MLQELQRTLHITRGDQKVSVHLMITMQSPGAQRLFDHPVQYKPTKYTFSKLTF